MRSYILPPEGFNIGTFEIKFYGLIMSFAMLLGVLLSCRLAKKRGVKSDDIILLALFVLPLAVVGARLYYCLFYSYDYSFKELFNIRQGGLALYGGVIGGVIGILLFCVVKKNFKLFFTICDIVAPALILGQAIGRWGNFFNQEAYGNLITTDNLKWFPYGVFIESKNAWYQATFFYESLWNIIGFVLLLVVFNKFKSTFTTAGFYFVWYGLGRTFIEGLRSDSLYLGSTSIRVSQVLSMVLVVLGVVCIVINLVRRLKHGKEV